MSHSVHVALAVARNVQMRRLVCSYALFIVNEVSVWLAVLVFAFERGGATTAGLIAVAQLLPAAVAAPFASLLADLRSPRFLLLLSYGVQGLSLAVAGVAMLVDQPAWIAYGGAIIANTALVGVRPAQATLLPSLAHQPDELTACNVVMSWIEAVAVAFSGLWAGLLLLLGPGQVLITAVAVLGLAALLVAPLHIERLGGEEAHVENVLKDALGGIAALRGHPLDEALMVLIGAEAIVLGAMDVLYVVIARQLLGHANSWVGYLEMAAGVGGILAGAVSMALIGRNLSIPVLVSSAAFGLGLVPAAFVHDAAVVLVMIAIFGMAHGTFQAASRTALQRTVAPDALGRVFGLVEGLTMACMALGSGLVAVLDAVYGPRLTVLVVGFVLPLAALLVSHWLLHTRGDEDVPVVQVALLRSISMFRALPTEPMETIARALRPVHVRAGDVLTVEGEDGEDYFAIAEGQVDVTRSGDYVCTLHRGEGFGEIALLRTVPRTATVTARTDGELYALAREPFLWAVMGHVPTQERGEHHIASMLGEDSRIRGVAR